MLAPELTSYRVPEAMTDVDAAAFQMIYQTSYFGLKHRGQLKAGEVLLVHGAAGGVGTSAIQLGKLMGATVIATAGTEEKLIVCRQCGADHAINYEKEDFVEKVKAITNGHGADLIYDPVGGDVFDKSSKCIAWNGRLLVVGFTSGRIPEIAANRILLKGMSVVGLFWGATRFHELHLVHEAQAALYAYYTLGKLRPIVYREYPLSELPDALAAIETRASYGKIVLKP
jgi:NADPH2:quinone reductase